MMDQLNFKRLPHTNALKISLLSLLILLYASIGCASVPSSNATQTNSTPLPMTGQVEQTHVVSTATIETSPVNESGVLADTPTATQTIIATATIGEATITLEPAITPTLSQPLTTPIPTLPAEGLPRTDATFQPIENSAQYLLVSSNQFLWHPNQQSAMPFPLTAWYFSGQAWSPDGQYLATGQFDGEMGIFSLATGELELLENTPQYGVPPAWSPDGRYLFYIAGQYGNGSNPRSGVIYDLETRQPLFEFGPAVFLGGPGWSFDSKWLAFLKWEVDSEGVDQVTLEVVNIETREHQVYDNPADNFWLGGDWSPVDNRLLLYGTNRTCNPELPYMPFRPPIKSIDLFNLSTGETVNLREKRGCNWPEYDIGHMPWSPAGDTLIYVPDNRLCFFDIGSATENCMDELHTAIVQAGYEGVNSPSWSPDGEWIAFFLRYPDLFGEYVSAIRPDGTDLRISTHTAVPGSLIWSPAR